MLKRIFFLAIVSITFFSCSSDNSSNNSNGVGSSNEITVAMTTRIDGIVYDTPPQVGGNLADASGENYGNTYFLLKGYKNMGTAKTGFKVYDIKIVIPKSDLSLGTHSFSSSIVPGEYYADFDISGVVPAETVNTTNGSITITSYNTTSKVLKGNFSFTTNDGVNLTSISHTLIGSFNYVLQ